MSDERQHNHDERPLRAAVDYEAPKPAYQQADRELTPKEVAAIETARRLEREEAFVNTGHVAGHDFRRENRERERGR